jgi:hypothetical protein
MTYFITRRELMHAQIALFAAILLQLAVWQINGELLVGLQYLLLPIEVALVLLIGFTVNRHKTYRHFMQRLSVLVLLALMSIGNASSLILVLQMLVVTHVAVSGLELLGAAIAIFMTNIIVFALWYWEIDAPGLSRKRWSKSDKDFQFPQQDMKSEFPGWRPQFFDYFYLSLSNAVNFAPADARPLTHAAKILMGSQALISVLTLALVVARSVSILGS